MGVPGSANFLLAGAQGYQIERSLRFNSADSAYLNKIYASAGNRQTWTWSGWIKRSKLGTTQNIFGQLYYVHPTNRQGYLGFTSSDTITYVDYTDTAYSAQLITSQVFRDVSAWYHIVCTFDTTNATSGDRVRLYVNGTRITAFGTATYPSQNYQGWLNANSASNVEMGIGRVVPYNTTEYLDGYLAEVHFVDGQSLTPSSFGETDTITGVWKPKKYAGTYGGNGFYLKFADNSGTTSSTLGKDSSGNNHGFGPNNFSVTPGAGNDSMIDTPTPYADGGNGRGNYCTLNPVAFGNTGYTSTISDGNLQIYATTYSSNNTRTYAASFSTTSGKWYFETDLVTVSGAGNYLAVGWTSTSIGDATTTFGGTRALIGAMFGYSASTTTFKYNNSTASTTITGASSQGGDRGMIAVDFDAGKLWIGKNGSWWNASNTLTTFDLSSPTATFTATGALFYPVVEPIGSGDNTNRSGAIFNFGQRAFAYTPPSGFLALNTQNLPEPSIKKPSSYFDTLLYTGNGSARSITGLGFSPDLVWIKERSGADNHRWVDAVRGATKELYSSLTNAEATDANGLTAFNSDGFSLGTSNSYNENGVTHVAWCWDESATPGFDIVLYTGNGSNRTISHSLGVAPSMMIVKNRSLSTENWRVYHQNASASPATGVLNLSTTGAFTTDSTAWNNTAPTSSVFSVATDNAVNRNGDNYVAYLWSEVAGFSKFGSYTGNGSTDGVFIYCGFRPAFFMIKRTDSTGSWIIFDNDRIGYNQDNNHLLANASDAEYTDLNTDIVSNGFKFRSGGGDHNGSGATYVFAAWAESPFKYSLAR